MPDSRRTARLTTALAAVAIATTTAVADPINLSAPGRAAFAPDIAVGRDGSINVAWLERTPPAGDPPAAAPAGTDAWFARSDDGGTTFTAPVRINASPGSVWGFPVSRPRLQAGPGGTIHAFYPGYAVDPASGANLVVPTYTRSTDGGRRFEPSVVLGGLPRGIVAGDPANGELFGTLVVSGDGGVLAAWIDLRSTPPGAAGARLLGARSSDDGRTFGAAVPLVTADVCPCCQPTAVAAGDRVFLGLRLATGDGYRDSAVAVSTDGGRSFGAPLRWDGPRWTIDACPLKPTALAVAGRNLIAAAFAGAADPAGVVASRASLRRLRFRGSTALHPGAAVADAPVLATTGDRLVAAWHAKAGGERRVFIAVSRDAGRSFGAPVEVPAPPGTGSYPALAARTDGVQLAWQQGNAVVTRFIAANEALLR